jgi:hypothetical protein
VNYTRKPVDQSPRKPDYRLRIKKLMVFLSE